VYYRFISVLNNSTCYALPLLFYFWSSGCYFMIHLLTLWQYKSLPSAVARALFNLNAHWRIVQSLSGVKSAHVMGQHCPICLSKVNPLRPELNVWCTLKRAKKFSGCNYIICSWWHLFMTSIVLAEHCTVTVVDFWHQCVNCLECLARLPQWCCCFCVMQS
jgi:hypothetical protein